MDETWLAGEDECANGCCHERADEAGTMKKPDEVLHMRDRKEEKRRE